MLTWIFWGALIYSLYSLYVNPALIIINNALGFLIRDAFIVTIGLIDIFRVRNVHFRVQFWNAVSVGKGFCSQPHYAKTL